MNIATFDDAEILSRAEAGLAAERAKIEPLGKSYFKASASALGIVVAVGVEMFTLNLALHQKFVTLSTGVDAGAQMEPMRYGIGAALLFGHVILHDTADISDSSFRGVLRKLHVLPILAVVAGMGVFMATTTAEVAAGDDGHAGIAGMALGIGCGCLFAVSFMACNKLVGALLPAMHTILSGWAQRAVVAKTESRLKAVDEIAARCKGLQRDIAEREDPSVLRDKAAAEAADIVGRVAALAHDQHASAQAVADLADIRPQDVVNVSPMPVTALEQRAAYLKSLDMVHFLNLLNKKGA